MESRLGYAAMAAILAAAAFTARKLADANARRRGPEIQFEESAADEVVELGLNR